MTRRRDIPAAIERAVRERDGHSCRKCGNGESIELHHLVAFADGGEHTVENLVVLCCDCHDEWTKHEPAHPPPWFTFERWLDQPKIASAFMVFAADWPSDMTAAGMQRFIREWHKSDRDRRRAAVAERIAERAKKPKKAARI